MLIEVFEDASEGIDLTLFNDAVSTTEFRVAVGEPNLPEERLLLPSDSDDSDGNTNSSSGIGYYMLR